MKQYLYNHCGKQEVAILETQAAGSRPPVLSPHYVETPKALVYFYCRFQQHSCKMRYLVMRFKSYFAFYTSQGSHTHQVQKIQLPTKIRQMIYDLYTQANVVRTIMIALDKKNDAGLKDIFGAENMDVLKKVEKRNKLEKMIKSRVDYLKSESATSCSNHQRIPTCAILAIKQRMRRVSPHIISTPFYEDLPSSLLYDTAQASDLRLRQRYLADIPL